MHGNEASQYMSWLSKSIPYMANNNLFICTLLESGCSFKVTAAIQKQPTPRRSKSRMQVGLPPTISEVPSAAIQTPL